MSGLLSDLLKKSDIFENMSKPKFKSDYIFVIILNALLFYTSYISATQSIILSINTYIAFFVTPLLSLIVILNKGKRARYIVPALLLLALVGLLNYTPFTLNTGIGFETSSGNRLTLLSFDSLFFLIGLLYVLINHKRIHRVVLSFVKGTPDEQASKEQKLIKFYYDKFSACSNEELVAIYKNYADYPPEAKQAIDMIKPASKPLT